MHQPSQPPGPTRIFLIGYRGAGKTMVARLLAHKLGWSWVDADEALESKYGKSIRTIFMEEGETGFRAKEATVLEGLCRLERHVIATGGGVVLRPANRARMKAAGPVVWLTADAQTLFSRLQADAATAERRPALSGGGIDEVIELLQARTPFYAACADWIVDTAGRSPDDVAAAIFEWVSVESGSPS